MKVCHFISTSVSGGGSYFSDLFGGLAARGVAPVCVELGGYNPPPWLEKIPQAKYFNLGVHSKKKYLLAAWRLARILRRERVDVLQSHLYDAGLIGLIAGRLARTPIVAITRHHTSVVKMLGKNYHVMLDRWMADFSDQAVVVSDAVRRFMKESDGVRKNHIEVIHIGFDFERLMVTDTEGEQVRREFGFASGDFVVGYVGQFIPGKGHLQLVEAFQKIAREIPEARLFLVGSGQRDAIDRRVDELNLKEKIVFAGWRRDVPACLKAMDVFVQPSLSEAFSQVIVEAMAAGAATVATDVGGAREVITDGVNGLVIPPDDPAAISAAVIKLHGDKEARARMAADGQTHVRQTFTVEKMVGKQIECYRRWLGEKGAS